MSKVRFGILGAARIATTKVIPALDESELCQVAAIASRDPARAEQTARKLNIAAAYGSYDDLLADPNVDAVYIPLPNHLHVRWSIRAIEAGKHVLCEKPIGLSARQAEELLAAGGRHPELKLMEGFMYRHHPQWHALRERVAGGDIGELRTMQVFFSYFNDRPDDIRNSPEAGGGALMDIGCYAVSASRLLFGREPQKVEARMEIDPRFDVDRLTSAILDYEVGSCTFTCGTQLVRWQRLSAVGTTGCIELERPFNPPPDAPSRYWVHRESGSEAVTVPPCNQFALQGDAFARAVLEDSQVPTPIGDAVANMRAIEAIVRSGRTGRRVPVE